jgi:hypothetical protein
MLSGDLYIRFKRALHLYKNFVKDFKNNAVQAHNEPNKILNMAPEIRILA